MVQARQDDASAEALAPRPWLRGGLRRRAASGTIVNAAFQVGLDSLSLVKGFVVAAFLSTSEYGVWGILVAALGSLLWLKQIGVGERYVQQDEADQELAFQRAFTLELILNGLFLVLLVAAVPLMALIYGRSDIILPGFALAIALPAFALQSPTWIFYRRMDYRRQRAIQAVDPLSSFVVTIALAVAGLGYWSLVAGAIVGCWAGAIAAILNSPYRLAWRFDGPTARSYASFSWPLLAASASALVIAQSSTITAQRALGIAAVGAIGLAATISQYTTRVDGILTATMYPAICRVRDRADLLFESFVKSNRLALMWGLPFGIGLTLFTPDLIDFALGSRWRPATGLLQAFGAIAAVNHLGFNWDAYFRARTDTRPIAVANAITMVVFLGAALPLMVLEGLGGLAVGWAIATAATLAARFYYLARLFPAGAMLVQAARALAPTVPAALAVLAVRALESGPRSLAEALAELALYVAITAVAAFAVERPLLREVVGYLRAPQTTTGAG